MVELALVYRAIHLVAGIFWAGASMHFGHQIAHFKGDLAAMRAFALKSGKNTMLLVPGTLVVVFGGMAIGKIGAEAYVGAQFPILMLGATAATLAWIAQLFAQLAILPRFEMHAKFPQIYQKLWTVTSALIGIAILGMATFRLF